MNKHRRRRCHGGSAFEMALMLPWFIFLFVGAFDWGYYAHALISTESAARVGVMYASTNSTDAADSSGVCKLVLEELRVVPNVGTSVTTCSASPVVASTQLVSSGADGQQAAQVSVTYTTLQLIPIPGLLANQATFYRQVQMRLRG